MLLFAAVTVMLRLTDGSVVEGPASFSIAGTGAAQILSFHSASTASPAEAQQIAADLAVVQADKDRAARDQAVERLTAIGLPVMTPLLNLYKDTDQHEPRPLYRLFEKIISSQADGFDRTQGLLRLANGQMLRVGAPAGSVKVDKREIPWSEVRTLAVRQKKVSKTAEVHSIRHSTQIEYFDTGIVLGGGSQLTAAASGFTRLSWKEDGWATDPNGLTKPGSPAYKTNLVDGHPFGALLGRLGAKGATFAIGKAYGPRAPGAGRLGLAINDNRHWQNNLGTYQVKLTATDAYDVGQGQ
ncbi:MAG: hypothetical protein ACK58M_17090 [Acidobacteriota bacterium]|jgi:hypothetical protein|nr:hypothetical protein [Bryobacteraceae bacterium CoA2 C42]MCA2964599.1 hypothetical protein [Acidobacteriaceae bacterium]